MDSIIFDLDGTLWDSRKTILLAWNKVLQQHKEIKQELTVDDFKATMGLHYQEIGEKLFPYLDEKLRMKILDECCDLECHYIKQRGGELYSNVESVLKALSQKYKLFIVSNCQDGYIEAFYIYHKLEKYFIDYENPGRTGLSKGENIKLVMDRNQLSNPVYVGDTEGDQRAAEYAGIPFVYADYGFGSVEKSDYIIDKFCKLLGIF